MPDGRETPSNPKAYCRGCGYDFSGDPAFDKHRVGKDAYLWSPERPDGRRCMDAEELAKNFEVNKHGRLSPRRSKKERERLALLAQR